jgi:TRAP-type C4-dicarboxylate transport system substrate-binding protein
MGDTYGRRMTRTTLISLLAVAALAGCGSESSDRAGGAKPVEAKFLTMANANPELGELEAFDEAVGRISGGPLRIKWLNEYGKGRDGNVEVNLIRDVSAGNADLGWAGTRVFDELGDAAFNPLHAPMLIDSYELEEKVLSDGLVAPMLETLGDLELRGIGVLPGPLRRPLGKRPLRGPGDWAGARISESGGAQIEQALRALGAKTLYDNPSVTEDRRVHASAPPPRSASAAATSPARSGISGPPVLAAPSAAATAAAASSAQAAGLRRGARRGTRRTGPPSR